MVDPTNLNKSLVQFFVNAVFNRMEAGELDIADGAATVKRALTLFAEGKADEAANYMRIVIAGGNDSSL